MLATALGLFLAFSWAGLWLVLPPLARAIGLLVFVLVTAVAAAPLAMLRLPSVAEGLRRLDRSSGEAHRPATAVADEIAANQHDPVAQALWRAHVERALLSARKLKAGWPSPKLSVRDPMALRALVLILAVATFFAAGGERLKRVTAAFDWQGVVAPANFRIDAWVTPPVYTGRAAGHAGRPAPGRSRARPPSRWRCRSAANWWSAPPAMCTSTSCAKAVSRTQPPDPHEPLCRRAARSAAL